MPHGVFMLVDETNALRVIAVSTNTEKIFGRRHDEILGTSLLQHFVERQRIETALTMRELSLANPVTLGVAKLSDDDVRGTVNLILHRFPDTVPWRYACACGSDRSGRACPSARAPRHSPLLAHPRPPSVPAAAAAIAAVSGGGPAPRFASEESGAPARAESSGCAPPMPHGGEGGRRGRNGIGEG